MSKIVLAIQGSFKKDGHTTSLLKSAVKQAEEKGYEVTEINLFEKNIGYCHGCNACLKAGECVLKNDDMGEITGLVREADVIILAAPVYWGNVPAIVKNLFDRLRGAAMEETKTFPRPRLNGKKYVLITSCSTPMPFAELFGQSSGLKRVTREFFKTAGVKCAGTVVCDNTIGKSSVPEKYYRKVEKIIRGL